MTIMATAIQSQTDVPLLSPPAAAGAGVAGAAATGDAAVVGAAALVVGVAAVVRVKSHAALHRVPVNRGHGVGEGVRPAGRSCRFDRRSDRGAADGRGVDGPRRPVRAGDADRSEGSITASSKVSVTFPEPADNDEPSAGSLL